MSEPATLKKQLDLLKFRWKNACNQYIAAYPNYAINPQNNSQFSRSWQNVVKTYQDIQVFKAKMTGVVASTNGYLESKDAGINEIKNTYNKSKVRLETELGVNNASPNFKKDKYYENSKSYIFASYYLIGLLSIIFFMYKQNVNKWIILGMTIIVFMVYYVYSIFNQ
jgi:hypothetical protein